jgi:hypothetical protein
MVFNQPWIMCTPLPRDILPCLGILRCNAGRCLQCVATTRLCAVLRAPCRHGPAGGPHRVVATCLMHAKFMHKLCSLLLHIPTNLDVMRCIIMFCIDLWGFSIDPLIFVITLHNRKHLVCVFLRFRDLPELKRSEDFSGVSIFPGATI